MTCFVRKLKTFDIKDVVPLQEQFKEHLKRNFNNHLN